MKPAPALPEGTTIAAALSASATALASRLDAELLLGHLLGLDRSGLLRERERALDAATLDALSALVAQRADGVPLAYLTGRREFWSLDFAVDARVLVPRPETELLVETALALAAGAPDGFVVDVGTGSGAIAVALAHELPARKILAVDDSPAALAVATANVARLAPGRVQVIESDLLAACDADCCALIVSNPPYVEEDWPELAHGVLRHEPRHALAAGADGLAVIRRLVVEARRCLRADGWLALEHGATQGAAVRRLLGAAGLCDVVTQRDLAGHERVSAARRPAG